MRAEAREPTVSVRVVRELVATLDEAGFPLQRFLEHTQLELATLESAEHRVPRSEVFRCIEAALDLTGDPALGLHWAERLAANAFNLVSHLVTHASNLRQAFDALARFGTLLADQFAFEVVERDGEVTVRRFIAAGPSPRIHRFASEMVSLGFVRLVRQYDPHAVFRSVNFEYAEPSYHAEYTRVFGSNVRFAQSFTGVAIDRALLDAPSPRKDEGLHSTLRALAEQRIWRIEQRAPLSSRVRTVLMQRPAPHRVAARTVARSLGLSVRSLHRRLTEEGVSYTAIATEASASLAKRLLVDERRSIQEAAHAMEFADTTSFHRAFKRWLGETPSMFRAHD